MLKFINDKQRYEGLFETKDKSGKFVLFYLSKGKGETFDISGREAAKVRKRFAFGGYTVNNAGCFINDSCTGCSDCEEICPFDCIYKEEAYVINSRYCVECGLCYKVCTQNAIELPKKM
ncbi:MAG: 4Fe-4S binding protein [Clostridiales bacterium]|nr:4Fe-4S binding protein [Clostridiales bacterium]